MAIKKKLYRSAPNRILGGVCAGLSHYFGISKAILRFIFFASIFVFGVTIPFYIILWSIIPKARTEFENCEMKGSDLFEQSAPSHDRPNSSKINSFFGALLIGLSVLFLVVVLGIGFSVPIINEAVREINVSLINHINKNLNGALTNQKAFTVQVMSKLGSYVFPILFVLIYGLKQMNTGTTRNLKLGYLLIAGLICWMVNVLF